MASGKISELRSFLFPANILGSYSMTAAAAFLGHFLALANKAITLSTGRPWGFEPFYCIHSLGQRGVEPKSMSKFVNRIFLSFLGLVDIAAIGVKNGSQWIELDGGVVVL